MKKLTLLMAFLNAFAIMLHSQEVQVRGKVTSAEDGSALPGASVVVKGTNTATVTDPEGNYVIKVPAGSNTLVVSFVGMKTQEVEISGRTTVDVVLQPEVIGMEEVVVTALGISKERKAIGYAVQDVKSEDLTRVPNLNMINSLNGRVAGVQITSSSGVAGSSSYITIRGANSITGNNQPLFVVDGITIDNSMNASGNPDNGSNNLLEGVAYSNRAIDLNPEDIESVTVLKGGAASALYGIRAANGVIIITTKKGKTAKEGQSNITFNSSVAFDEVNKLPELQNKFVQGQGGKYLGPQTRNRYSWGPNADTMYWDGSNNNPYDKHGFLVGQSDPSAKIKFTPYDNLNTFFQTGITYDNSVSFTGGNENSSFYANLTNLSTKGIVPNNTFDKTSVKITGETKLTSTFTVEGSANYIKSGGNRVQQGSNLSGVMLGLLRTPISFDNSNGYSDPVNTPEAYMFEDGTPRSYRGQLPDGSAIYDNPYWTVNKNKFKDDVDRLIGYIGFRYQPLSWLNISYKLGTDYTSDKRLGYFAKYSGANGAGQIQEDNHNTHILNSDLIFTITSKIGDDVNYNLMLGNNLYQEKYKQFYVEGNGISQIDFYHMSNVTSYVVREYLSKYRTAALYANADITYKSFLTLTLTGRQEWSTTLPKGNNSFFFPSASMSFVLTELEGFKNNEVLTFAKLRASIAKTANDAPVYYTRSTYSQANYGDGWTSGISFPFLGLTGYSWGNAAGNPNLKPEFTQSMEGGFDLRLIKRIGFSFTYFKNKSTDLILTVPVAASSGYSDVAMNAASMENKGVEITADVDVLKTNNLRWNIGINYSKINNKVLSLAEGVDNVFLGGFEGAQVRAVKNYPYGSLFGTTFVKDANGNVVIDSRQTVDGEPNPNYGYPMMSDKEEAFGTTLPDWTAGINTTLSYKGFSLYALLDIRKGGVMWNGTRGALVSFGMAKETEDRGTTAILPGKLAKLDNNGNFVYDEKGNIVTDKDNNIQVVKDESWYNGLGGGFAGPSEQFTEKTDWVRLREVSLSYTLPQSLFKKGIVKGITITASGKNLWLSTPYKGVDPETNLMGAYNAQGIDYFNMPNTRSYVFGVKFNF